MKQFAKIVPLVKNPTNLKTPKDVDFTEAAKALAKSFEQGREQGSFEVHVVDDNETPLRMEFKGGKPALSRETTGKADFSIKANRATLAEIAKGDLSPVDAYLAGRVEVHGDLDFGKRLFARLAAKTGDTDF